MSGRAALCAPGRVRTRAAGACARASRRAGSLRAGRCGEQILHYKNKVNNGVMKAGHVFTIEPMVNEGVAQNVMWKDNWTATNRHHAYPEPAARLGAWPRVATPLSAASAEPLWLCAMPCSPVDASAWNHTTPR
jgi:hypothetical protein